MAQYRQTQRTTTTCGKTKDGINHQYAEQLEWCVLGEIIERKPKIVAIIGDCTLVGMSATAIADGVDVRDVDAVTVNDE